MVRNVLDSGESSYGRIPGAGTVPVNSESLVKHGLEIENWKLKNANWCDDLGGATNHLKHRLHATRSRTKSLANDGQDQFVDCGADLVDGAKFAGFIKAGNDAPVGS